MHRLAGIIAFGLLAPLAVVSGLALTVSSQADASDVTTDVTIGVAIDVDTTGNGDNVLGPTESCNETPLEVGNTIDVDVVVRGIPAYRTNVRQTGISGFTFDLVFNPAVIEVASVRLWEGPTILRAYDLGRLNYVDYNFPRGNESPGTTGDTRVEMFPYTQDIPSGDGVLTRVSLQAVGDGASRPDVGQTPEGLDAGAIFDGSQRQTKYLIRESEATVIVGSGTCAMPTPTAFPTQTPARLPLTGGPPGSGESGFGAMGVGLLFILAAPIAAFACARYRTMSDR